MTSAALYAPCGSFSGRLQQLGSDACAAVLWTCARSWWRLAEGCCSSESGMQQLWMAGGCNCSLQLPHGPCQYQQYQLSMTGWRQHIVLHLRSSGMSDTMAITAHAELRCISAAKAQLPGTLELKLCLNRRFTRRQGAVGVWRGWRRSAVHDAARITCSMAAAQQQAVAQQPAPSLLGSRACTGMCLAVNSDLQTLQEPGS